MRLSSLVAVPALLLSLTACAGSPEQLASSLQSALEAGDQDAAMKLVRFEGAPAQLHYFFLDQVGDCGAADTICTATVAPLDAKFEEQAKRMVEQGLEANATPEGLIVAEAKTANGKNTLRMPYARVDGDYRIVSQRYSAAKLAELRATRNETLAEEMLAQGVYDPATGERDTDWKSGATALPAGGGDVGAAYAQQVASLAAATAADDPDAAVASGDGFASMAFAATDYAGKPVTLAARKAKLRAQGTRALREIRIDGGWQRGDDALLLFEGRNGIGWIKRGVLFVSRGENGVWGKAGESTVEYPAE